MVLVCRMFSGGRETLWAEKLGLVPRFAGNAATRWGTRQEEEALARSAMFSKNHDACYVHIQQGIHVNTISTQVLCSRYHVI